MSYKPVMVSSGTQAGVRVKDNFVQTDIDIKIEVQVSDTRKKR
jgi:hypothetical protein